MDDEPNTNGTKTGRRTVLALGVSTILAGCVGGSGGDVDSSDPTTMRNRSTTSRSTASTTVPDSSPTATSPAPTTGSTPRRETDGAVVRLNSSRDEPQTTATIGKPEPSSDGSGTITVWNDAGTTRAVRTIISERNGETVFEETYRLEPDAYAEIEITKSGTYTLGVAVDGDEQTTIDFVVDTCNSLRVNVAVRLDGAVESTQVSTLVGCWTGTMSDSDD